MSDQDLRSSLIRLASTMPKGDKTRRKLLAIVQMQAARLDPGRMNADDACYAVDDLRERTGEQAADAIRAIHDEVHELHERLADIKRAWEQWDWRVLTQLGLVSDEEYVFVRKVESLYSC